MSPVDPISLGEGGTPLVRSRQIGPREGIPQLYFKLEGSNPTGSYKDRFAAAAVSDLVHRGCSVCLGTSSGNTGAALAAYSAAAQIPCILAIVDGAPAAKLRQMQAFGAKLVPIRDFGMEATQTASILEKIELLAVRLRTQVQVSAYRYSPVGMQGVESIAAEIAQCSGVEPLQNDGDRANVFVPAGGGGLALAVARGFAAPCASGGRTYAVHCVQPEGNDTIATPLREGLPAASPCVSTTKISGLQVASVIDGNETIAACRSSGGTGFLVPDAAVFRLQERLAREEGIYAEPAGAVALAGALKAVSEGHVDPVAPIVCLVTGSGFKDERTFAAVPVRRVDTFDEFEQIVMNALRTSGQ